MQDWIIRQWNDIKGNVKFYALTLLATLALTLVGLLTHGLTWWQQAILLFILGAVLVWAIYATVLALSAKPRTDVSLTPGEASLRERVFALCNELSAYAEERDIRPDSDTVFAKYGDNSKLFAEHYEAEIQSWDDKLNAGYHLRFRDRAIHLRHELVLTDVRDRDIDNALSALDRPPDEDYLKTLQTLIEKMRYAASLLP